MPEENKKEKATAPFNRWRYGGIGWRFIALIVDTMIIFLFVILAVSLCFSITGESFMDSIAELLTNPDADASKLSLHPLVLAAIASYILIPIIYGALFESSSLSATPGKLLLGISVCSISRQRATTGEAFARNILKQMMQLTTGVSSVLTLFVASGSALLSGFFSFFLGIIPIAGFLFFIIDYGSALFSRERQAVHDSWSKTLVMSNPDVERGGRLVVAFLLIIGMPFIQGFIVATFVGHQLAGVLEELDLDSLEQQTELSQQMMELDSEEIPEQEAKELKDIVPSEVLSPSERLKQALNKKRAATSATPTAAPTKAAETPARKIVPAKLPLLVKKNETAQVKPTPTPVIETLQGAVAIQGKTFNVLSSAAALSDNNRAIVLNLYDQRVTPPTGFKGLVKDQKPLLRFILFLTAGTRTCRDSSLEKYTIEVNSKKSGINHSELFMSFKRSGSQIISKEYLDFSCKRSKPGWIRGELKGHTAFLLSGKRIPIKWSIDVIRKFS